MSISAEVGPFVTGHDVEAGVVATLRDWLPSYLAEGERKHNLTPGAVPRPRGWTITGRDLQKFTSDQLPCVIVMAGGIVSRPLPQGNGLTDGTFMLDVGVIFNAAWGEDSRRFAQLYIRAVSLVMVQRPLIGLKAAVDFNGEQYDEIDFADTRTYSAAVAAFIVAVDDIFDVNGGPPPHEAPPGDPLAPFDPWVQVKQTEVKVTH